MIRRRGGGGWLPEVRSGWEVLSCLEIEHAGGRSLGDVLGGGDLVKSVELEELVVAGLGGELLGVDNSRLEGFALRGSHF
jgi:hypothetical protein